MKMHMRSWGNRNMYKAENRLEKEEKIAVTIVTY
jgi:hypothetical protein